MAGSPSFDTTVFERPRGLPPWVLWALLPVAMSFGVVAGVATATYRAVPAPPPPPAEADPQGTAGQGVDGTPTVVPTPGPSQAGYTGNSLATGGLESSWEIPGVKYSTGLAEPLLPEPGATSPGVPNVGSPDSGRPPSSLPILQARSVLTERFSLLPAAEELPIGFSYQVMRGNHGGNVLVGLLNADDYRRWEKVVTEDEDAVRAWLLSAMEAVRPLSQQEGFHLVWAIVDNIRRNPYDTFAQHEVILMEDRTFLIIRPLAASPTTALQTVTVRPVNTVWLDPSNSGEAWHVYRPTLRFDGSDIYRPTSANPWR